MNKYITYVKRDCDREWDKFETTNIDTIKSKLGNLKGEFEYRIYKQADCGKFEK